MFNAALTTFLAVTNDFDRAIERATRATPSARNYGKSNATGVYNSSPRATRSPVFLVHAAHTQHHLDLVNRFGHSSSPTQLPASQLARN